MRFIVYCKINAFVKLHGGRGKRECEPCLRVIQHTRLTMLLLPEDICSPFVVSLLAFFQLLLAARGSCCKAREYDSQTVVQPCNWFKDEPSQFSMGQTESIVTCSIMEKPHTGLHECLRILLSCFRARNSSCSGKWPVI